MDVLGIQQTLRSLTDRKYKGFALYFPGETVFERTDFEKKDKEDKDSPDVEVAKGKEIAAFISPSPHYLMAYASRSEFGQAIGELNHFTNALRDYHLEPVGGLCETVHFAFREKASLWHRLKTTNPQWIQWYDSLECGRIRFGEQEQCFDRSTHPHYRLMPSHKPWTPDEIKAYTVHILPNDHLAGIARESDLIMVPDAGILPPSVSFDGKRGQYLARIMKAHVLA